MIYLVIKSYFLYIHVLCFTWLWEGSEHCSLLFQRKTRLSVAFTAHFDLRWSGPVKLRFCQCKEVTTTTVFLLDKEKAAVAKTEIHQHNSGLTWFYFFWFGIVSICFSIMSSVAAAWEHIHIKIKVRVLHGLQSQLSGYILVCSSAIS